MTDLFLKATKAKLRYESGSGAALSTEQLWDLPLQHATKANLDTVAIKLSRKVKARAEESFVRPSQISTSDEDLALAVVKQIISIRLVEQESRVAAAERVAERQRLQNIIAQKKDEALVNTDLAELEKRLAALG